MASLLICAASAPLRPINPTVSRHVTWVWCSQKLALTGSRESMLTHSQATGPDGYTLEARMELVVKRANTEELEQVYG